MTNCLEPNALTLDLEDESINIRQSLWPNTLSCLVLADQCMQFIHIKLTRAVRITVMENLPQGIHHRCLGESASWHCSNCSDSAGPRWWTIWIHLAAYLYIILYLDVQ